MEFATKHFLTNIANKIPSLFSPFNYPIVFYYTCASMSPCRKICLQAIHIHWIINIALLKIYCIFSRICITIDKIYPSHILSSSYTTALAIVQYSNAKGVFCGNCSRTNYIGCCFFLVPYVGLSKTHSLMYLQHQTTCKQCILFDIISCHLNCIYSDFHSFPTNR